ncbi:polysaccharide biosynthesis protein [Mangrovimonas yunxiaonensis]|uniref:Polysaccharide biosynthesis protein n=1 Tax=Mangrovimonas yunxiaonensis TaxID=1197477 RepID=A0A084TKK5_9FLAO|nr:oligosaccharide flippase family protein [Mangrovimonas yunxiaonensis]KFB01241.1 polysaccharide biosynthesis protein [Mangrovimonas yunxiaonensis]GGH37846.1 teichoic acid transporter [Mangrovimonas yunxiaonensis]
MKIFEVLKKNKKIIENFSYLSIIQLLNMLIPLIVFPYLIRVLGGGVYGLVIYAQAVLGYFVVFINFGFNITATKEISINKHNKAKLDKILSSILIIKGFLLLLSLIFLSILIFIIPSLQEHKALFYLTFWMCFYEFIFPMYYFQGVEEMKYITIITLISRVIFLLLVFILINHPDDYLLVPIINGLGAVIAGIISQVILLKKGIKYSWQKLYVLKFYIKKSFVMALAYASNTLKSNLNIVIVKFLFSYKEVAYFDLALKISRIGTSFLELISVSVFPKMSRDKDKGFLRKIIYLSSILSITFVVMVLFLAPFLVKILGGEEMLGSVSLLRVVVFFVPLQILGGLLGRNCLIVNGYEKDVLYSMAFSSIVYLISIIVLYPILYEKMTLNFLGAIFVFSFMVDTYYRYLRSKKYKII